MIRNEDLIDGCIRSNPHLPLHKGESKFLMLSVVLVSRKYPGRKRLISKATKLAESGLQQHLEIRKELTTLTNTRLFFDDPSFRSLQLFDVNVAFLILAIGYGIAAFFFLYFKVCSNILLA